MDNQLQFDFSVNKEDHTITVKRAFAAPLEKVWSAWTQSEFLDQWWAPKPYQARTKSMDFRVGGFWLYAMVAPDESKHWSRSDFKSIAPQKSFSANNSFCDEEGNITHQFASSFWTNSFSEEGETTLVTIFIKYEQQADMEQMIAMGFKEGFTAGLNNLEALLKG